MEGSPVLGTCSDSGVLGDTISVCTVTILFGACLIVSIRIFLCCCADRVSIAKAVFVVNKKRRRGTFSFLVSHE